MKWNAAGTVWKVSNKWNGAMSGSGFGNRATYRLFAVLLLLFLIAIFIIPEARKIVLSIGIRYQSAFLLLNRGKKIKMNRWAGGDARKPFGDVSD